MALTSFLFVAEMYSVFFYSLSAEGFSQFSDDSAVEGNGLSYFIYQTTDYPRDCSEVRDSCSSSVSTGVYLIKPDGYEKPFEAYCDNENNTGSWTIILRRFDGSVDFNRTWSDYKKGFGFLSTEFWLGIDKLSYLTNQAVYELHIDVTMDNGTSCNVRYNTFRISDEWGGYKISVVGTYRRDVACIWREGSECNSPEECDHTYVSTNFSDCNDVYDAGNTQDGVYYIHPAGWYGSPFKVFCNMTIDGGSWTVFQRRVNGSTNFYRNWTEYRNGFGDLQHEFWLGNEKLHYITQQATYEYRLDFVYSSSSFHNKYSNFHVDSEANKYRLADVGTRTGTKGYSLYNIENTPFSTYDEDNDGKSYDCAAGNRSGWWHGAFSYDYSEIYCVYFRRGGRSVICSYANLNGDYNGGNGENIYDYDYHLCHQKYTELKIRRIS